MSPDNEDGSDDLIRRLPRSTPPELMLIAERQRRLMKRVDELEKKQDELTTLMNKGVGAIALLVAIGAGIGWLISIGGSVARWFR